MNKLILLFAIITLSFSVQAQIDISEARGMAEGMTVTIEGIATNGEELGIIRYIQDGTGGIPAYPGMGSVPDFPETVKRGDLVRVTGPLKIFNGLLEIDPVTSFEILSSNNAMPVATVITADQIDEANEGKLVQVNDVKFDDAGSVFATGEYGFEADGLEGEIYIRTGHPLIGSTIPLARANLTGISSEFNTNYQLLLRDINDIEIADNFYFTGNPVQSAITKEGFNLEWATNVAGTTKIEYGTTDELGEEATAMGMNTNHSIMLAGLEAGTIYYVKAVSDNGTSTIESNIKVFATESNSTGAIRVYFNHGVDGNYSNGSYPTNTTPAALESAIINRINAAQSTIDVSVYNTSREPIVAALTNAHNNGIRVRYIADDQTGNLALENPNPPFRVLKGSAGDPLMHNKFMIVDAESEDNSWVLTGSTNWTTQNVADDYNNAVFIQDQSLARAYTIEFEEMWGSDTAVPSVFFITFGEDKKDNTPHLFKINGMTVESYFSPSDNTTVNMINALNTADTDVEVALLTLTNNELSTVIRNLHNDGVAVRGILDMINGTGSDYDWLVSQGVNVTPDNESSKQTHHKYAIIDATDPSSDPMVITGSHNWSASAETRNDENTLIIHDADIANIFLQEFEARWCTSTTGASCITNTEEVAIEGFEVSLSPNPAQDFAVAKMELAATSNLTISLLDVNGRILQSSIIKQAQGRVNEELILTGLAPGMYYVMFKVNDQYTARPLTIVR